MKWASLCIPVLNWLKWALLGANLERRLWPGAVLTLPAPRSDLYYQQGAGKIDTPWVSWRKRINPNLIWLWCIIFILAGATKPLRTHHTTLLHFKTFKLEKKKKNFSDVRGWRQQSIYKLHHWGVIYCVQVKYKFIKIKVVFTVNNDRFWLLYAGYY